MLKFGSTVSSRMDGSPTPRARSTAGTMTDVLHTMIAIATLTPPIKNGENAHTVSWGFFRGGGDTRKGNGRTKNAFPNTRLDDHKDSVY